MNLALLSIAQKALQNKHTTGAAVVYAVAKFGCPLAITWMPAYKQQLEATANILEGAAVFYGFAAAGDSAASASKKEVAAAIDSGDTSELKRKVDPQPQKPEDKKP